MTLQTLVTSTTSTITITAATITTTGSVLLNSFTDFKYHGREEIMKQAIFFRTFLLTKSDKGP